VIRAKRAGMMLPVLETILSEFGRRSPKTPVVQRQYVAQGVRPPLARHPSELWRGHAVARSAQADSPAIRVSRSS
jgi:hypothetical protein